MRYRVLLAVTFLALIAAVHAGLSQRRHKVRTRHGLNLATNAAASRVEWFFDDREGSGTGSRTRSYG